MPRATLSMARLLPSGGAEPGIERLRELLERSKAEVGSVEGDAVTIEATADRLDLLTEGGLGIALEGALGTAVGLPEGLRGSGAGSSPTIRADSSVADRRPVIAAIVVRAPDGGALDAGLLAEAIRFQELLHATVGADRTLASLGLYPYDRLRPPFLYRMEPTTDVTFAPLDGGAEVPAPRFLSEHPMAARYGALGTRERAVLTLRDAAGTLMSLPPILNARPGGEVRVGDRTILIESTGTRPARVSDALGLLSVAFVARGWSPTPVRVEYPDRVEPGESLVAPRSLELSEATLKRMAGRPYPANEVEHLLASVRLSARPAPGGWRVEVPPWRPDLLGEVDLVEEVVLARGLRPEDGVVPASRRCGRRRPEARFRLRWIPLLLGAGYSELHLPVLVSERSASRLGHDRSIAIDHPVSDLFARVRDALRISLVDALADNRRAPYPQRVFEVGPIVVPADPAGEGAVTRYRAGALLASESAGFADMASLADYLLGTFGAAGVRSPVDLPEAIPGRAAELRIAGARVGELGELHPRVLEAIGVPVPAAWLEVDLTSLWPLVERAPIL